MSETTSKLLLLEARAILAAVMMVGSFIILPIFAIFAPDFFQQIYVLVFTQLGWVTGYYFGAKNHEKRTEYILNQLIALALRGVQPQSSGGIRIG